MPAADLRYPAGNNRASCRVAQDEKILPHEILFFAQDFYIAGTFLSLQHVTAKATVSFVRNSKRLLDGWTSMASSRLILDSGGRTWVIQDETNALKAEGRYDYCQELSLPSRTPP